MRRAFLAVLLAPTLLAARGRAQDPVPLECTVKYVNVDGVFLDVGTDDRVAEGLTGWLVVRGERLSRVEVRAAAEDSAYVVFLAPVREGFPEPRDPVTLLLDHLAPLPEPEPEPEPPPVKPIPLLADEEEWLGVREPRSVWHGRLALTHTFQDTTDGHEDLNRTRFETSGSGERIDGTPWSLTWDANVTYRSGQGYEGTRDFQRADLDVFGLAFSRRFDDASTLSVGRFIPAPLPSIGFLDGVMGEKELTTHWRGGAAVGFKPDRKDLAFSFAEPTLAPWLSYRSGERAEDHYALTAGLLMSRYESHFDRCALLLDQSARQGRMDLWSSLEVDLDVGNRENRSGVRLTRGDLIASFLLDGWTPSLGVSRFELADLEAERDQIDEIVLTEADFFQDTWTRAFAGASHRLGTRWILNEQVSYVTSRADDSVHWRVGVTRTGLFGLAGGSASLTAYNLTGLTQDGYGARLAALLPLTAKRLTLQPAVTFRWLEFDTGGREFQFLDAGTTLHWNLRRGLDLSGGVAWSQASQVQRVRLEFGVTWRF